FFPMEVLRMSWVAQSAGRRTRPASPRHGRSRRARVCLRVERLETRDVLSTLVAGPNINIAQPSAPGSQSECSLAMAPYAPNLAFTACNLNFFRYSEDGGYTWRASSLAGIPSPGGDNQAAWDDFGNLFVVYLSGASVRVVMSTNNGRSFSL